MVTPLCIQPMGKGWVLPTRTLAVQDSIVKDNSPATIYIGSTVAFSATEVVIDIANRAAGRFPSIGGQCVTQARHISGEGSHKCGLFFL